VNSLTTIWEKAHELVDHYSNEVMLDIINIQNLDVIENKMAIVVSFRDRGSFNTQLFTFGTFWSKTGFEIVSTLNEIRIATRLILDKIESVIKLIKIKGKLYCRDVNCLGDFVSDLKILQTSEQI
jgi:hypothetical protein